MKSLALEPLTTSPTALENLFPAMPHITKLTITEAKYDDKFDGLLRVIAANLHHLKYLDISDSDVDPKAIEYILPTEGNALGGCPELVHLDLMDVEDVDVELVKKIILVLPKLRFLEHGLMVNALGNLTEEEMGEDTARHLTNLCASNCYSPVRFDLLAKSPAFQRFKNNITTVDLDAPLAEEGHQEAASLADVLMCLPKLTNVTLCDISEADHHVSSLLESIGERLEYLTFYDLSGNLSIQDIMRTCTNLVELCIDQESLMNVSNRHQEQTEEPSKLPVLKFLTEIDLDNINKDLCSADMLIALLQSPNLETITLLGVEAMSDDVMFNVLSSGCCTALSKVTEFSVDSPLLTAEPLVHWLNRDNCSLEQIFLSGCEKIDYQMLRDAAENYPRALLIK